MRDPLQPNRSPYEVLGLERDATRDQIKAAFTVAMKKDPQAATDARRLLNDPKKRALIDVFEYDPTIFTRLLPTPQQGMLAVLHRATSLRAWEETCRTQFPDIKLIHSMAVFWYWWLEHIRQEQKVMLDFVMPGFPPFEIMFERLIACWTTLLSDDAYWRSAAFSSARADLSDAEIADLKQAVRERLLRLLNESTALVPAEREGTRAYLRELESLFPYEIKTAEILRQANIKTSSGRVVACGGLMLAYMVRLDSVRITIEEALRPLNARNDLSLRRAQDALSAVGYVRFLLEQERPEEALRLLDRGAEARESADRQQLRADILLVLGRQEAANRNYTAALAHWGKAIDLAAPDTRARIQQSLVALCQDRVESWGTTNRHQAIGLLEEALKCGQNAYLGAMLGELLCERALSNARSTDSVLDAGAITLDAAIVRLQSSVADITRAMQLAPGNADIRSQSMLLLNSLHALQERQQGQQQGKRRPSIPSSYNQERRTTQPSYLPTNVPPPTAPGMPAKARPGSAGCASALNILTCLCVLGASVQVLRGQLQIGGLLLFLFLVLRVIAHYTGSQK